MVDFSRFVLSNGLRVLINEDHTTPLVAVNLLYEVGSRNEQPEKTGFAHLFEHLMFEGSKHIPDFDGPLQSAGGENNAFTTNDHTNFYEIVPAENLETVLWLESDRMMALKIAQKSLEIQRKVVVEEFKETCLNEPYGDYWHHLSAMSYTEHPYRWPVIGLVPDHIENASLQDVKDFFKTWYGPNNAILSISGKVNTKEALLLVEKWFGSIDARPFPNQTLPQETAPLKKVEKEIFGDVPVPAIFMAFRTPARNHPDFYAVDLLSDILANGQSSRLFRRLLKEKQIFSSIDAYLTATIDPGLIIIEGKPSEGVSVAAAMDAIRDELNQLKNAPIETRELEKIKHRYESTVVFSETSALNKAQSLGFYESMGDANLINTEVTLYLSVTPEELQNAANAIFSEENVAILTYFPAPEK
jgi:zinc protease